MKQSAYLPLVAALIVAAAMPAAAAPPPPPSPAAVTVPISHFRFQMDVTVRPGGTVTWKNLDGEPHTVVAVNGGFRSGALDEGDSYSFKFTKPGVYSYLCSIHPQMRATVTVR